MVTIHWSCVYFQRPAVHKISGTWLSGASFAHTSEIPVMLVLLMAANIKCGLWQDVHTKLTRLIVKLFKNIWWGKEHSQGHTISLFLNIKKKNRLTKSVLIILFKCMFQHVSNRNVIDFSRIRNYCTALVLKNVTTFSNVPLYNTRR